MGGADRYGCGEWLKCFALPACRLSFVDLYCSLLFFRHDALGDLSNRPPLLVSFERAAEDSDDAVLCQVYMECCWLPACC